MLEHQDSRTITLVEVIEVCRTEATKEKLDSSSPLTCPSPCQNGQVPLSVLYVPQKYFKNIIYIYHLSLSVLIFFYQNSLIFCRILDLELMMV